MPFKQYKNLSGDSGIESYDYDNDSILVNFKNGSSYLYNNSVTGAVRIQQMKQLADIGAGLGTFIKKHVRKAYAKKLS
jgi:hypothetical protein